MKKILVVYYSRKQTTKKVAEILAEKLGADIEEIKDTVDRRGVKGYWLSGKDATLRKLTVLEKMEKDLSNYELVIIGTPIWSWNMSVPVRTYITENKDKFCHISSYGNEEKLRSNSGDISREKSKDNFPEVAFFCTMGGSGDERAFKEMSEIIGKDPVSTLALKTIEVVKNSAEEKIEEFIKFLI